MAVDEEVLGWLREAAEAADSWESVRSALSAHDPDGEDARLRPFIFAYAYHLHERSSEGRDRAGTPYGAMLAGDGWRFPPSLEDLDDEDVTAWRYALAAVDHPVAQARLGDLLWVRKSQPDPHLAARAAADGLRQVSADESWRGMDRVRCISRALELALETRDSERQTAVVEDMVALAERHLDARRPGPGIPLGLLRPLVALPAAERPPGLNGLLHRVAEIYGADPYIFDAAADLRVGVIDEKDRTDVRRQQVERWREESTKGDTMLRAARLEQALELARNYGLKEEADDIRRELGAIKPEDLGLQRISTELEIPAEQVEQFLSSFGQARDWRHALLLLAAQGPPGGSPAELEQHVDQLMQDHPVQFMFTKALVGPDNATSLFRAETPEQHRKLALAEQRAQSARMWGLFCARALERIGARSDRPDKDALAEFLTSGFIEAEVAERIARAIELFWQAEFDESAHILVPRLERVLREMARQVGIPIVREPRPDREVGGVEMLGALLRDLEAAFADKGWHSYLLNLLAEPLGLNLRNRISHGLHGTVGPVDASLLVQAALVLRGMSIQPVDNPPEPPAGATSTD